MCIAVHYWISKMGSVFVVRRLLLDIWGLQQCDMVAKGCIALKDCYLIFESFCIVLQSYCKTWICYEIEKSVGRTFNTLRCYYRNSVAHNYRKKVILCRRYHFELQFKPMWLFQASISFYGCLKILICPAFSIDFESLKDFS